MAKKMIHKILLVTALTIGGDAICAYAATRSWEPIRTEQIPDSKLVARDTDLEVRTTRGCIFVTTNHTVTIKVYSILGQLVTSDTLQPGTHRLNMSAHGVYIVKIGDITCKIAV